MKNKMFKINNNEELLLLTKASGKNKEWLLAHPEYKNFWALLKYKYYLKKLHKGIPVAYILGHKEFFGLDFLVNKHTLIPRPDTEILVDKTIKEISNIQYPTLPTGRQVSNILMIDVGTGTGCIPITILNKFTPVKSGEAGLPSAEFNGVKNCKIDAIATDISKGALKIAQKNAKKHNVKINFLHGDLLSPVFTNFQLSTFNFQTIIITANLPYLKEDWWKNEPSIQHEPKSALVSDNETGLYLYEKLLQQISDKLSTFNFQLLTFLEIDPRQSTQIFSLIQKYLPEASIEINKDLSGFDRVVKIKNPPFSGINKLKN